MCSSASSRRASRRRRLCLTRSNPTAWPPPARPVAMTAFAYLDHNATSPLRPAAYAAMAEALRTLGNPSSVHAAGRRARAIVEHGRRKVADVLGASPTEIVFTSGGTEANNMAIAGAHRRRVL